MGLFNKEPKNYIRSNLKFSECLPIGSVVTLKDLSAVANINKDFLKLIEDDFFKTKKFIITGYNQDGCERCLDDKNTYIFFDYYCAQYPMGVVDGDLFVIRQEDIQEVIFRGYDSPFRNSFMKDIECVFDEREFESNNILQGLTLDLVNQNEIKGIIPLGSVVLDKNNQAYIISSYYPTEYDVVMHFESYKGEYGAQPYPCEMEFDIESKFSPGVQAVLKKYGLLNVKETGLRTRDIKGIIFEGYRDEAFERLAEAFKS